MNRKEIEADIESKNLSAPRVTLDSINSEIVCEHYFTARDGAEGASGGGGSYHESLGLLTFCVLVLRNGFTVTGESACASPSNFDAEIGRKVAREKAVEKLFPLLGFRLRDQMAADGGHCVTDAMDSSTQPCSLN